jgi:hypothetical protein
MPAVVYAFLSTLGALFRSQLSLRIENVALRHQLAMYQLTVKHARGASSGQSLFPLACIQAQRGIGAMQEHVDVRFTALHFPEVIDRVLEFR